MRSVLCEHLWADHGIHFVPSIIKSSPGATGGGNVSIERLAKHMAWEYHNFDAVTSFVDWYGFKDRDVANKTDLEDKIFSVVSDQLRKADKRRIIPYVQMHEFEALLFSDVTGFSWVVDGWSEQVRKKLERIAQQFLNPEDINDSHDTCPSRRIVGAFGQGSYRKREHGPIVAEAIGLSTIRYRCAGFHQWLRWVEALPELLEKNLGM